MTVAGSVRSLQSADRAKPYHPDPTMTTSARDRSSNPICNPKRESIGLSPEHLSESCD